MVLALGEAKAGELITDHPLRRLEAVRSALGKRVLRAKLLPFGAQHAPELCALAADRTDVELVAFDQPPTRDGITRTESIPLSSMLPGLMAISTETGHAPRIST
jgi:hypothetical protein